ncbi:MAG: GxGYxYP domain-containing protein [Capsulimonadaceae bacterium]
MKFRTIFLLAATLCAAYSQAAIADSTPLVTLPVMKRPYPGLQPTRPAPAEHLYVADVTGLDRDEQLLMASLQGIVNRRQPRIYLICGGDGQVWLDEMRRHGETGDPILVKSPLSLVETFRDEISGAVVSDPNVYESPCIAVDISGLKDEVIATPALAEGLGLPIKDDLRGRFKDDAAALHYARTELLPKMNPWVSLCLDPAILGCQIDDIIAARGTCFWITGPKAQSFPGANEDAEWAEVKAMLAAMPLGAIVRGFWWRGDGMGIDECPGVTLASQYGKITTVSDYVVNYSVMSGVHVGRLKQKPQPPAPKLDPSKVYIAIGVSDGDNLCTWRGYFQQYFTDPLHGTFPIAWGMGPTLLDVAPVQARWFYEHAAPTDEFFCDVSGVGYIYPPVWAQEITGHDAAFQTFYDWTSQYMKRMDMHTLRLMNIDVPTIPKVGAALPSVPFLFPDYGWSGEGDHYGEYTYTLPTGQPVFRAITSSGSPESMADQIRKRVGATRPAFANVFISNWDLKLSNMKHMLDLLGPDYVPVTPSQLNTLYRESLAVGKEGGN